MVAKWEYWFALLVHGLPVRELNMSQKTCHHSEMKPCGVSMVIWDLGSSFELSKKYLSDTFSLSLMMGKLASLKKAAAEELSPDFRRKS